jgi:hypothetical protein
MTITAAYTRFDGLKIRNHEPVRFATVSICDDGYEIGTVEVENYDQPGAAHDAVRAAGYNDVNWIPGADDVVNVTPAPSTLPLYYPDAEHDNDPEITTIVLGRIGIDPEQLLLDPEYTLDALTDEQRNQMNAEYRDAWTDAANAVLSPLGAWAELATGLILGPLKSSGQVTEEMLDEIRATDADPAGELFEKWEAINDQQA